MIVWIDAQLSPMLAEWMTRQFTLEAEAVRNLGLCEATDHEIFMAAKRIGAVVVTKDADFIALLERFGPPPRVIWLTCGNTSNRRLREILATAFPQALELLDKGEAFVEISDAW